MTPNTVAILRRSNSKHEDHGGGGGGGGEPTPYLRLPPASYANDSDANYDQLDRHVRWCLCCSNLTAAKFLGVAFFIITAVFLVGNMLGTMALVALPFFNLPAPFWVRMLLIWSPLALCALFTLMLLGGTLQKHSVLLKCAFTIQVILLLLTIISGIASIVICLMSSAGNDDAYYASILLAITTSTTTTTTSRPPSFLSPSLPMNVIEYNRNTFGLPDEDQRRAFGGGFEADVATPLPPPSNRYDDYKSDLVILIVATLVLVLTASVFEIWCLLIVHAAWKELERAKWQAQTSQAIYFHNNHSMVVNSEDAVDAVAVNRTKTDKKHAHNGRGV